MSKKQLHSDETELQLFFCRVAAGEMSAVKIGKPGWTYQLRHPV